MLGRLRGWFLLGAVVILSLLFVGLIHDFGQTSPEAGWITARPGVAGVLLGVGYLCMLLHRIASSRRREE